MPDALIEDTYAAAPLIGANATLDGGDAGKLLRVTGEITITLSPDCFHDDQWVEFLM